MRELRTALRVVGILLAATLFASACSEKSPTDKAAASEDPVAESAIEELRPLLERPTEIGITEALDGAPAKDKTVYWIQCGAAACVALGDSLDDATSELGWKLIRIDAGLSPETVKNAWGEAARAVPAPDAVISSGFPREIFDAEIASLASRDIPVINLSVNDKAGDGLTAVIGGGDVRPARVGEIQATWVVGHRGSEANTVMVTVPAFPTHVPQAESFSKKYESLCPDCELGSLEMPAESMGTDLPQRLVAHLQANPEINTVVLAYGDMAIGVPSAVKAAGLDDRVDILTDTPDPTVAKYISEGDVVLAATGYPGDEMAWRAIDIVLRHMQGSDLTPSTEAPLPNWVLTADTIPSATETFPLVEDFREQYLELWGLA